MPQLGTDYYSACLNRQKWQNGAVKKQPVKNGGFQEWDPPLTFALYLVCGKLFAGKMGAPTTSSGNCGFPGDIFQAFLCRFLCCQLPQMVLVEVKTARYQP